MGSFAERYGRECPRAVESYPREHWQPLKTTNPIESIFAPAKLRTNAAKAIRSPGWALYLVFRLITMAQKRWRRINAPELVEKVIEGVKFDNGKDV